MRSQPHRSRLRVAQYRHHVRRRFHIYAEMDPPQNRFLHPSGLRDSTPLFTQSVKTSHMPKEHPKAAVEDTLSEDIYPSDSVRRSIRTGESTHISSSQAAASLTSSRRSTRPRKASICDDNPRLETISSSRRSESHPHAPPSNSVGDTYAYKHANIASLDSDLL
jgi:hypothetical protein